MDAITDGSAACGACRTTVTRFMVLWEMHYGFSLVSEANPDARVWVVFADDEVQARFARYFAGDHLASLIGHRVLCDCVGLRYTMGDVTIFRITNARLFTD